MTAHAHEKRWRALAASTQWSAIFGLLCDVRNREGTIRTWKGVGKGGALNKTKARTALARDRALLDLLRAATPADVWADAEKAARGIGKSWDEVEAAKREEEQSKP